MKIFDLKTGDRWLAFFVALAWLFTFIIASSECFLMDFFRGQCKVGWAVFDDVKSAKDVAAAKGQFGDVFGVLNGAFGALTLFFVYRAFRSERASSDAQISLVKLERYYAEVAAAVHAYEVALQGVAAAEWEELQQNDKPSRKFVTNWTSKHGLFHLWKQYFTIPAIRDQWAYSVESYRGRIPSKVWAPIAVQMGIDLEVESRVTFAQPHARTFYGEASVTQLLRDQSEENNDFQDLSNAVNGAWWRMYGSNRYQLDLLFRTWYHAFKTIATADDFDIDEATEWRIASRFRAQLSWIEMVFLLANQTFGNEPGSEGFPRAVEFSERYAMFDNFTPGLDPTVHALLAAAKGKTKHVTNIFTLDSFESDRARKALGKRREKGKKREELVECVFNAPS
jgi:hypothetical protein